MKLRAVIACISLAAAACFVFTAAASADTIGDLKLTSAGTVNISLSSLAFTADPSSTPPGPPWNAEVNAGTSLKFAGCASGTLGTAGCLSATEAVQMTSPLSFTSGAISSFVTFSANSSLVYSLSGIAGGSSTTNCATVTLGNGCSPIAGSPLIFSDTATGTSVLLSFTGQAKDGTNPTNYMGLITIPFAGLTPEQVLTMLCPSGTCTSADVTAGRTISGSFTADLVSTAAPSVPEPGTLVLFGSGLLGVAGALRRKLAS
ncbi:MAG TPA: PEP-CTERM sorting domain-containing protein [Candidatus Acidoferrales bacterium]|nr:PEP-CTERM sorting domain-containing protein [Candidatus Acidoferrales bacterium]